MWSASADADDRIVFQAGLSGTINLGSDLPQVTGPLEIQGPGSDKLAIDGGDTHSMFVVIGGGATISGLTLRNGSSIAGGAVALAEGTSVLDGVRIESNQAQSGGGVVIQSGSLTIRNSELIDNKALNSGGGFIADSADLSITGTTISGNEANIGAGGSVSGGEQDSVTITDSRFSNNTADARAVAALAVFTPTVEDFVSMPTGITGSTFTGNKSTADLEGGGLGGGAIFTGSSDTDIDSSLFEGNSSASIGGAVYLNAPLPASRASILNSTFAGNTRRAGRRRGSQFLVRPDDRFLDVDREPDHQSVQLPVQRLRSLRHRCRPRSTTRSSRETSPEDISSSVTSEDRHRATSRVRST